jgi:hypothetical protein
VNLCSPVARLCDAIGSGWYIIRCQGHCQLAVADVCGQQKLRHDQSRSHHSTTYSLTLGAVFSEPRPLPIIIQELQARGN